MGRDLRKLLQNLPPSGANMQAESGMVVPARFAPRADVKRFLSPLLSLVLAAGAAAQTAARPPAIGPSEEPPRRSLWQVLTPDQRDQLWRSLSAEQRADVWRSLEPQERREIRERLAPGDPIGGSMTWTPRRQFERGDGPPRGMMMTPEERRQMREQIREAQRLQRERIEAERAGPPGPAIGPAPSAPTQ